jgi:AraC-like DNA-binding protein
MVMQVHEARSAAELEEYAAMSFAPVVADAAAGYQFRTDLVELDTGLATGFCATGPMQTRTTRRDIARADRDDTLMFCIHLGGTGSLEQRGRSVALAPGTAVLYEAGSPWQLQFPEAGESLTLQLPRELLPLRGQQLTDGLARPVDLGSPALQLLHQYLSQVHGLAAGFSAAQRGDAGRAAIELLAMTMRGLTPAVEADDVLVEVLREHIRRHLHDSDLTVTELARRHHISVRQAHAVFARAGSTPAEFVRLERLRAARRLLADPTDRRRTVAAIANAVGFAELRTFERAFHREYGLTPAQWRSELATA